GQSERVAAGDKAGHQTGVRLAPAYYGLTKSWRPQFEHARDVMAIERHLHAGLEPRWSDLDEHVAAAYAIGTRRHRPDVDLFRVRLRGAGGLAARLKREEHDDRGERGRLHR